MRPLLKADALLDRWLFLFELLWKWMSVNSSSTQWKQMYNWHHCSFQPSKALWQTSTSSPSSLPALHIYVSIASTTTSLSSTSPLPRCARAVLGEFPVQTKPSSPSVSLRFHPLCLSPLSVSAALSPHGFTPLSMPRVAPTRWHQKH